ncbi:autotransporter assembly complex protein TamA [Hirschia litorea]|uniref:Autotransporter assembly complex family protein n=1 Tax=Hirschia litorea TaxID=1199156 RepID=A0ABW2IJM3_9PROT
MTYIAPFFISIALCVGISTTAHAQSVEITGEGVDDVLRSEIFALQGELEAPTTKFAARRQARRTATIALDVLNSKGWLDAKADIAVEAGPPLRPLVRINKGRRFTINTATLKLSDDFITQRDLPPLEVRKGQFAQADTIINEESRLLGRLKSDGFAYAKKGERLVIGDRETASIDLTYNFTSGPKICLGDVVTHNPGRTRTKILETLSPYEFGDRYNTETIAEYKTRLSQTQLFTFVKVELSDTPSQELLPEASQEQVSSCQIRDVEVTLEDGSRRSVSAGASFATTEGLGLQAGYEMRNYSGRADTVNLDLQLNNLEQSLSGRWKQPLKGGYRHALTLGASIGSIQTDAFDRDALTLNALYERPWIKHFDVFAGIGGEIGKETQDGTEKDFQIISGRGGLRFDNTDDALNPSQGLRVQLGAEPAYSIGDAEGQFLTTDLIARGYLGFNEDKLILASRLKVGGIAGSSFADIPSSRRFYAGGGGSVRGYAYQAIGPRNDENEPIGGRSLVELSLEARLRFANNLGMAVFVDAGEVGASETPAFSDFRMGAGLGVRYYTSFGPLRFDIATPIDPREDDESVLVYLSIGQAF